MLRTGIKDVRGVVEGRGKEKKYYLEYYTKLRRKERVFITEDLIYSIYRKQLLVLSKDDMRPNDLHALEIMMPEILNDPRVKVSSSLEEMREEAAPVLNKFFNSFKNNGIVIKTEAVGSSDEEEVKNKSGSN